MQIHSTVPFALATRTRTDFSGKNSLNSKQEHSTVSLESKDTVHFGVNSKIHRDKREALCRSIGFTDTEIQALKDQVANTDEVKNADTRKKTDLRYRREAQLMQREYNKRVENISGDYDGAYEEVS